ncbi:MAG: hypothetical protein H6855_06385 [Rhodospirillales bacterium]|nr:hypothetical protein [Rhodospirillales bacterium]MCB9980107.1 hypothetical protein [Rhodospirillales bacterium]
MTTHNKIAQITIYFWILKIMATTLGETTGDMLSMTLNMGYVAGFGLTGLILLILLFFQIKAHKFHSLLFWASIIGTTTVGTEISDMMDRTFGLGYLWGSAVLVICLLASLGIWYLKEKSLRVYPITHKWPEVMFWIAVLFSNSLGTAFGDYLTDNMELSYLMGAFVTSGVIGIVMLLHYTTKISDVLLFWAAFIFTRPFGATFGDFLTKPLEKGGLNLDTIGSSAVILILFSIVLYISHRKHYVD